MTPLSQSVCCQNAVERCDKIKVAVSQILYRVKSVALWSANIRKLAKDHKSYGFAANPPLAHGHFNGAVASTFLWKFKFSEWQIVYFCWQHN